MAIYRELVLPNPSDLPDGPGAFLAFAQSIAPRILVGVDDFDELATFSATEYEGGIIHVDEGNLNVQSIDGSWVQINTATFASAAARNSAYAKASGAFRVDGALAKTPDDLWPRRYVTSSSSWRPPLDRGGILPIKPPTVAGTNVSVNADGTVVLANATAASLDGVFVAADGFSAFRVVIDVDMSAASQMEVVLRAAGVDKTSGYDRSRTGGTGTSTPTSFQAANSASWVISASALIGRHYSVLDLSRVPVADETHGQYTSTAMDNPMTAAAAQVTGGLGQRDVVAGAHDGFKVTAAAGNLAGTIRVFGIV